MRYEISGGNLPVLKVQLDSGENIQCEAGAMSWMDNEIEMQTSAGGLGKMFGRMLTKENAFMNTYLANRPGEIAFSSKFPGSIRAVEVTPGNGLIVQKGSFLASCGNINNEVYIQKHLSRGLFGGEGFLMRRFTGSGLVFLEIDGSAHEYDVPAGDCKIVDTGYVAAMSESCRMEVQTVKGIGNVLFGGEGLFNTVVYGPGHLILQSMPIASTAMKLYEYMPHPSGN
ncbi:MAG: TIGR00266 family protein [Lachnospiraceae bacterium]|uniref:TIGR00266 family protein n=1 Tax=Candidatus Weimeria bifida TaxID=2599074 RepID=A0A6N7IWQ0_9FIRM|nr:TIGR00266 family protein [Candidatus Weimeria bifida]RRF95772.1 MAG: TIGR00266 family protein [Lachnospiraceae bacterium]